jgi:hypothetical protein
MLASIALLAAVTYPGHDVLITGERPIAAYAQITHASGGATHFDMWETAGGKTIRAYDINMTKLLHMIVVSDDLRDFRHIHPVLHADGHFTIDVADTKRELYHVYIDGDPHDLGRDVFRFDIPLGPATRAIHPVTPGLPFHVIPSVGSEATRVEGRGTAIHHRALNQAAPTTTAGPYRIAIDTTTVSPGEIDTIRITITENDKPATDLHPYLGAMAHGVFIGTRDLAYMHGHGMDLQMLATSGANDCGDAMMASMPALAPDASVPATFAMQVLAPTAQPYDFWIQFTGGTTLYTVPFLITAR